MMFVTNWCDLHATYDHCAYDEAQAEHYEAEWDEATPAIEIYAFDPDEDEDDEFSDAGDGDEQPVLPITLGSLRKLVADGGND